MAGHSEPGHHVGEHLQAVEQPAPEPLACGRCGAPTPPETNFCPRCGSDLRGKSATSDTFRGFLPGTVIDGRYRLLEKLGEGGMGSVFKVEHVRMGKLMALKVLRPDLALQPQVLDRFRGEARLVSRLSHPNTISVFDFGELDGGSLYIAMEYVKGRDLATILATEGRLTGQRAAVLGCQVLRSLEEAHEAGIVHRDIKPANVMLLRTRAGEDWAKVVDFGIAKLSESQAAKKQGAQHITGVAEFVGTPNYCAPEQARGQELDPRTDLYALGAMLFELVTGRPPYEAPSPMAVISRHLADPVPHPRERVPELSEALDAVIVRALQKSPEDRFASAEEMRRALEQVAGAPRTFSGEALPIVDGYLVASREDWDAFEKSLARGTRFRAVAGALLIAGLFGAGGYAAYRKVVAPAAEVPVSQERELNDDPAHANLIALDQPVTGAIGEPHLAGKSDLDTYRLELPSAGQLTVALSGVKDLNLVLELFDADKEAQHVVDPLAHVTADDGRLGDGELLTHVPVHAGRYYLRVSERPAYDEPDLSRPPRERQGAPYTLAAHLQPTTPLDETEPNDLWALAQPVSVAQPILGHAGFPVPDRALERDLVLGGYDYFSSETTRPEVAFVVQPPDRALGVRDAQLLEGWRKATAAANARKLELEKRGRAGDSAAAKEALKVAGPPLGAPVRANAAGVAALKLQPVEGRVGVLVLPLAGSAPTPEDAPYGLAFAHAGPGGLDGVVALASELANRNRTAAARALLQGALVELPNAEDAAKAQAQLDALK